MSVPPPSSVASSGRSGPALGPVGADRTREIVLDLPAGRGWRRRRGELVLRGSELQLTLSGVLKGTFALAGGRIEVAAVDRSAHGREVEHGRFPVLQRLSASAVVPFDQGFQGWVWTTRSGSGLPTLAESPDALPSLALVFVKPLDVEEVERCFEPDWVRALAARSPLGSPSVPGLLIPVADVSAAEDAFRRFGVLRPITDREVPPTMRRHLPGDRPADPRMPVDERARSHTSIAPPGFS